MLEIGCVESMRLLVAVRRFCPLHTVADFGRRLFRFDANAHQRWVGWYAMAAAGTQLMSDAMKFASRAFIVFPFGLFCIARAQRVIDIEHNLSWLDFLNLAQPKFSAAA